MQVCVVRSHASVSGQSLAAWQPQVPVAAAQAAPASIETQLAQRVPGAPHTVGDRLGAHVVPLQHVPLHACVLEHVVVHVRRDIASFPDRAPARARAAGVHARLRRAPVRACFGPGVRARLVRNRHVRSGVAGVCRWEGGVGARVGSRLPVGRGRAVRFGAGVDERAVEGDEELTARRRAERDDEHHEQQESASP